MPYSISVLTSQAGAYFWSALTLAHMRASQSNRLIVMLMCIHQFTTQTKFAKPIKWAIANKKNVCQKLIRTSTNGRQRENSLPKYVNDVIIVRAQIKMI